MPAEGRDDGRGHHIELHLALGWDSLQPKLQERSSQLEVIKAETGCQGSYHVQRLNLGLIEVAWIDIKGRLS